MSTIKLFSFAIHIHKLFFNKLPQIRITTLYGRIISKMANIRIGYGQSVPGGMSALNRSDLERETLCLKGHCVVPDGGMQCL